MKNIRIIQNAATFVSELTITEIKTLQKQVPMALALTEPNNEGGVDILCTVQFKNAAFGEFNSKSIIFVDADAEGYACVTVLIPANTKDKTNYLYENYDTTVNYLRLIEKKAKKALKDLTLSKDEFAKKCKILDASENTEEIKEENI